MTDWDRVDRAMDVAIKVLAILVCLLCAAAMAFVLGGCRPKPAEAAVVWATGAPAKAGQSTWFWCVAASATVDDGHETVLACADTEDTCKRERAAALKWGGMAGIDKVGECEQLTVGGGP